MTRLELAKKFADNLEIERTKMGISQRKMADYLDISLSAYKRMICYETEKIDLFLTYRLYQLTGKLSYEFLDMTDMYLDLKKKISNLSKSQVEYIDGLVDFEKAFKSSTEEESQTSSGHGRKSPKKQTLPGKSTESPDDYVTVYVPTGNMEDGMVYDSSSVEKINIAPYRKRYGNRINCGIRITSNHLHPAYNLGDTLLISRTAMRDGDTGVFINTENGCAYIRKFYQTNPCRLEPVTSLGETFYVDSGSKQDMDKWIKFGYVITKIR